VSILFLPTRSGANPVNLPSAEKPFLHLCMYCKGVRPAVDGEGPWLPLDPSRDPLTNVEVSHGVCPLCYAAHLEPQIKAFKRERRD
jgi:hypothetical protein